MALPHSRGRFISMMTTLRYLGLAGLCTLVTSTANAQTPASTAQSASTPSDTETRPAFTTSDGDTGLWYVPTAEVLARGKWSASGYRTSYNYVEGFSNVADFPLTFAVGAFRRGEIFGSFKAVTRIDRDIRPIFTNNPDVGGVIDRYPFVTRGWSGSNVGDFLVGAKINLLSETNSKPAAVAIRGGVKLPTGDKDDGVSTGKAGGFLDLVVSKDLHGAAEISGYGGGAFQGSPSGVDLSNGFRWGVGAGFPSRGPLHLTTEFNGEKPSNDSVTLTAPLVAVDGSRAPTVSTLRGFSAATVGLTFQAPNGFFLGAASTWSFPTKDRSTFQTDGDATGDFVDFQFRIGYHPGVGRRFVPPPPPPPPPPAAPAPPPAPANRPPTVTITCGPPCTVEAGQSVALSAQGRDPDGDTLTYRWTAPVGTFSTPAAPTTRWTAPADYEGTVPVTVTVDDGKGGTASASANVLVTRPRPPIVELTFEDVYFEFDRSTLRPDAVRLLDDAVAKLQANPTRNIIIEGHTCNIGTSEYNLALGERRARSVQNYLVSRGVAANRLEIVSYGEERPKFDNSREETRRLNRRAALVVKVQ
jgi:outer membrane protein OmpA-like peptidoglycan-associated protein